MHSKVEAATVSDGATAGRAAVLVLEVAVAGTADQRVAAGQEDHLALPLGAGDALRRVLRRIALLLHHRDLLTQRRHWVRRLGTPALRPAERGLR